jgi:short-chain Z-isoprenyl diphosphate synthase
VSPRAPRYGEPVPALTASEPAYRLYAWWLRRHLHRVTLPRHVALIMDGNRRWARAHGHPNPSVGHRFGAEHVADVLGWCSELGIRHVTVWVASADNIRKRDSDEVAFLMRVAEDVVAARLGRPGGGWRVHVAGQLALLPDSTVHALKRACDATVGETRYGDLTVAIGYSGRQEIVEAVRELLLDAADVGRDLATVAATLTEHDLGQHLGGAGQPPPDLIIRTSGEQRLSDFLLWQGADAELFFCDVYWPAFRYVDLLRALREYGRRAGPTSGLTPMSS